VHLVVVDLIPSLLRWDEEGDPRFPDGAGEALAAVFARYRLAGIADADQTGAELRRALDDHDLGAFFESIGTAAGFGPAVSPRVVRRMVSVAGTTVPETIVITGRPELAEQLQRNRFSVVLTEGPDGFLGVPAALETMESGGPIP
jgi:hypothetical protein